MCAKRPANRRATVVVGSVRFGSVRFGSVRVGSVRFGSVRLGSARLGSARFGSVRFGSKCSGMSLCRRRSHKIELYRVRGSIVFFNDFSKYYAI